MPPGYTRQDACLYGVERDGSAEVGKRNYHATVWPCHVLRRTFASGLVGGLFDGHCGSETVRVEYGVLPILTARWC